MHNFSFVLSVHHPDRHFTSAENLRQFHERRFKDIGEAYSVLNDEAKRLLYDKGLLRATSIPQQQQQQPSAAAAAFFAAGARLHPSNLAQTFAQAQTAAFWATYNGSPRSSGLAGAAPGRGGGLAGASPVRGGGGLAGARPFLFVPGAPAAASAAQFNGFNLNGLLNRQFTAAPRFGFQQHPFNKF